MDSTAATNKLIFLAKLGYEMLFRSISSRLSLIFVGLALIVSSCSPVAASAAQPLRSTETATLTSSPTVIPSTATAKPGSTPTPPPTATVFLTPAVPAIFITAVKGNIFIRRGPDLAYNEVSVLMDGQNAKVLARDVLGDWVQIVLPRDLKKIGWISIQTSFTSISGDVSSLPVVTPTDWPELASLRNCTEHQMEAEPGGIVIPSADNFPANDIQINPGAYIIYDVELDGRPEVMSIEIREGMSVDIPYDGDGGHKKCTAR